MTRVHAWLVISLVAFGCQSEDPDPPSEEGGEVSPIVAHGHGAFIDAEGKQVQPTAQVVLATQERVIGKLEVLTGREVDPALTGAGSTDDVLANGEYIDGMLAVIHDAPVPYRDVALEGALRRAYSVGVLGEATADAEFAPGTTIGRVRQRSTTTGGQAYINTCKAAGVPVPEAMFSSDWTNEGVFTPFLATGLQAELWSYESSAPDPRGICLALPRYDTAPNPDQAVLLGIICLGLDSNNVCFWDNPRGVTFDRNVEVPISDFVGGSELVPNGQGECTDCHSGENPFVVHPAQIPFASIAAGDIDPDQWYSPLVDPVWLQNPGPTRVLDPVASTRRCDSCHEQGVEGRFPLLSDLPGYCAVVLGDQNSGSGVLGHNTMPPGGSQTDYQPHIDALVALCGAGEILGEVAPVTVTPDPTFVSPPILIGPLYACSERITVRSAKMDARLDVQVDGIAVASATVSDPRETVIAVPALVLNQVVEVTQTDGGATSAAASATVEDHRTEYPAGLPAPAIDPGEVYACASRVAVRHVPGAKVTVNYNNIKKTVATGSAGYTAIFANGAPFVMGKKVKASQQLCSDKSPLSAPVTVQPQPAVSPSPTFDPPELYAGQELINVRTIEEGATIEFRTVAGGNRATLASWPTATRTDHNVAATGGPIQVGERIDAIPNLCEPWGHTRSPAALSCSSLPPPRITTPNQNDTTVFVTEFVPGAEILIFDANGNEIADSADHEIVLSRALVANDVLTVVQVLNGCMSSDGYVVNVLP